MKKHKITVALGDGIGPEIMKATLKILKASGANIEEDIIEVGEKIYLEGHTSGIRPSDWKKIIDNKVFLKAPITTPQGGGYKSLNVTIRKTLGLFANVRPVQTLTPYIASKHKNMDLVIVRENEEDLYAGIEHRQTQEVFQCLKLISIPGCQKIIRYAFEYAKSFGRKKVTCMTKDNIMKLTDGLFHKIFDDIAKEYPQIESEHWIIDIGAAKLADTPENFDVIVMPNLYGDILSDVAAQIAGSVGIAGSSNIGANCAMFEAIHGSAPRRANQNVANPSGLLQGAILMLHHLGEDESAVKIQNAWLKTIEDGIHTYDIFKEGISKKKVGTNEFADAVIQNLGKLPASLKKATIGERASFDITYKPEKVLPKTLDGIDIFVDEQNKDPKILAEKVLKAQQGHVLKLSMITNRGVKVYPDGNAETFCTDHWRCRFLFDKDQSEKKNHHSLKDLLPIQHSLLEEGVHIIKTENLYSFGQEKGYSLGQGQ